MSKKLFLLPIVALALAACGDDEEVTTAPDNAPTEQDTNNDEVTTSPDAPYAFAKFSFDAEYSATESIEADYSNESSGVEASYENDKTNERLKGNDAFTYLEPIFESFTFDSSTGNDEVVDEIVQAFNLETNYTQLEIDITFDDGSEREYTHTP